VVGPNGAGKSTLFGVILGFLHATSGDVSIDDAHPRDYMRRHGVGYVADRFALPPGWPVRRAMAALAELGGLDAARTARTLRDFGLDPHADKNIGALSRGLLQRFGLAQAFAAGRDLLVLDEPAEGLDPIWRIRLRDRIARERADGRTILLASHDLAEVQRVADTVIVLDDGTVRETIQLTGDAAPDVHCAYSLVLERPFDRIAEVFPNAQTTDVPHAYTVMAADVADLNRRLAALIEIGGRIVSVAPDAAMLERRVRGVES
jgi:ABC-2 type transport system ATP-binding protein